MLERMKKIIICSDFNGRVGNARSVYEGVLGQFGEKRINEAGKLILEICKERNLFVANTMFDHKHSVCHKRGVEFRHSNAIPR